MIAMMIVAAALCAGCESHAENKKLATKRWEKASANIKLTLAQQQYDAGRYDQAAKAIAECINADPTNPQAHLLYGKLLLAQGHCARAEQQLALAIGLDEQLEQAWYWLGVAAEQAGNYPQAHHCYSKAMELAPETVDYILAAVDVQVVLDKCREAQKLLADKMKALPGEISLKIAAADLMLRSGQSKKASKLYTQATLLRPNDDDIAGSLGYCHILGERWEEAAAIFETLIEKCREPQKKRTYLQLLCMCSMNARRYGRAVSLYRRLGASERENADFWLQMGQAALGAGAGRRAFVCSQRALALRPGWADAIALRGCAAYIAGDYPIAVETLEKVAEDEKNAHLSWLIRGRCYEQLGRRKEAEEAYKKALEIKPESKLVKLLAKQTKAQNAGLCFGF